MSVYYNYKGLERGSCSTVIIGKNASTTGKVIMGHNEDDDHSIAQAHIVPHMKHEPGEMVTFEDGCAIIPQVEETLGYLWTDVKCPGGISFADTFVNECGVAIATNACRESRDATGAEHDNWKDYNVGYALRRLIAERAHTAREGVKIAAELVEKYGYTSCRSYHIADKEEAWALQIPRGFRCVARRIGDDEVYYIPNHYTIHEVRFDDPDNFYATPDLITFAIEQGWYTPAKEGDYSDFDFAKVYQAPEPEIMFVNLTRATDAWKRLPGIDFPPEEIRIFSKKAEKKYSPEDVKEILRSHAQNTKYDMTEGGTITPHRHFEANSICNNVTIESSVFVFNDDLNLLKVLRTGPKPCTNPYVPWYALALKKMPEGYEWTPVRQAQVSHFNWDDEQNAFDPSKAWFAIKTVQLPYEYNWPMTHRALEGSIKLIEAKWAEESEAVENTYRKLKETDEEAAKEYLSDYTTRQAQKAIEWAKDMAGFFANDFWREDQYE
jgi:dipeptidase